MSWQGANVGRRKRFASEEPRRSAETVEATLNRLSKSYVAAMDCVGSCHRASQEFGSKDSARRTVAKVARTARRTMERSILIDPMVLSHAPNLAVMWEQWSKSENGPRATLWSWLPEVVRGQSPPVLTSASHRSTIRKLSYLSLINYADLLLSGSSRRGCRTTTILDRGATNPLFACREDEVFSCWLLDESSERSSDAEPEEDTARLALASYTDAVHLDGSDPTIWFKLAAAARQLDNLVTRAGGPRRYRRLERHALESAQICWIVDYRPPSRMIVQAWTEWQSLDGPDCDIPSEFAAAPGINEQDNLRLSLPRYSWAVVGRNLARACREGTNFHRYPDLNLRFQLKASGKVNVHPIVHMHISPLLTLPSPVLGELVQYLDDMTRVHLQCTCRALSVAVLAPRIRANCNTNEARDSGLPELPDTNNSGKTNDSGGKDRDRPDNRTPEEPGEQHAVSKEEKAAQGSRVSKRLQSRVETSGKRAERSSRRGSIGFCLLGATLGVRCFNSESAGALSKESLKSISPQLRPDRHQGTVRTGVQDMEEADRMEAQERTGSASLTAFVESVSNKSTPFSALFRFLSHVSIYIDDVYSCESHGSLVLSACVMDALDLLTRRFTCSQYSACWCTADESIRVGLSPIELFAVDLLHAEFRLKRCERNENLDTSYHGDINFAGLMIPSLLSFLDEHDSAGASNLRSWHCLKVRCYWLVSTFLLWHARVVQSATEVREIENECLLSVKKILHVFEECGIAEVRTPHLEGVGRSGPYWKKLSKATLSAFQNETQASSVVLVAQDRFVEAISQLDDIEPQDDECEHRDVFTSISDTLLNRYEAGPESFGAHQVELIDDFLSVHGQELSNLPISEPSQTISDWFESLVPLAPVDNERLCNMRNPCILTLLAVCVSFRPSDGPSKLIDVLVGVVFTLRDLRDDMISPSPAYPPDGKAGMSEDDDSSLESETESQDGTTSGDKFSCTLRMYSRLVACSVIALSRLIDRVWLDHSNPDFSRTETCIRLIENVFVFASDFTQPNGHTSDGDASDDSADDAFVLFAVDLLLDTLKNKVDGDIVWLNQLHVKNLAVSIVSHQNTLEALYEKKEERSHKWVVGANVEFLCTACRELGHLLSQHPCKISGKTISRSILFVETQSLIAPLCRSLIWLWKVSSQQLDEQGKLVEKLRIPVAAAVISVCGSASSTNGSATNGDRHVLVDSGLQKKSDLRQPVVSLLDVVDSDASVAQTASEDDLAYEQLLRVVFLAVQCVRLVSESIRDDEFTEDVNKQLVITHVKSSLPLVLERVLNLFADSLLINPSNPETNDPDENSLWGDYGFGARSIGSHIDKMLHRIFKALYGFSLTHVSEGRDTVLVGEDSRPINKPESKTAAAQLYRCVMRTCSHGRKTPPKAALFTITAGLPTIQDNDCSKALRKFLFWNERSPLSMQESIKAIIDRSPGWEDHFSGFERLWESLDHSQRISEKEDESGVVRRGLADLFSQGNMPSFENVADRDTRQQTMQVESELSNRFEAILYKLTHSITTDCKGWYRFSQLCLYKADLIADRIGMSAGFSRSQDFVYDAETRYRKTGCLLSDLISIQEKDAVSMENGWVSSLGSDLHAYLSHSWSSFVSLKSLQESLGENCRTMSGNEADKGDLEVLKKIKGLYNEGRFVLWQQAWGGIFISSLRIMAKKSMCFALFILQKNIGISDSMRRSALAAEICEGLGTALYTELMGSQLYGYPLQIMPKKAKRDIAEMALACYTRAAQGQAAVYLSETKETSDRDERTTWDLHFMAGKCHEKIAGTYAEENFASAEQRAYERSMMSALQSYSTSISKAQGLEEDGTLLVEQQGGSAHGSIEVLYRLHASRLKCLLSALQHGDREQAELEALRLTEPFPYAEQGGKESDSNTVRDRVWNVAVDIVGAMVHCRTRHSCFHRSVYRHAQALMWAPIFCDPDMATKDGSFGSVPALKALNMRGLNSDSAVESSAAVMRALFDKKRAQLCAVWVTSTSAGSDFAFQRINMEARKYDALRGKYASAFITCLRMCNRRDDLENFLRWTISCKRDLPSSFAASAARDGRENSTHTSDSLLLKPRSVSSWFFLTSVKREANSALASVIQRDVTTAGASRDPKFLEDQLKLVYSCFLRLNCDASALSKRHIRHSRGVREVVDALVTVHSILSTNDESHSNVPNDWSMDGQFIGLIGGALKKCNALFPSLSGSFLTSRKVPRKKKSDRESAAGQIVGSKRKEPDGSYTVLQQFNAQVPEGLAAGESFLAEIQSAGKIKRIRLTVPEGGASSLRFNLRVPAAGPPEADQA